MKYQKIPLTSEQHIQLLRNRNLNIPCEIRATKYLNNVGYYRLTGYMYHLQTRDGNHSFIGEVSFDDIINLYQFDKKLRAIIIEYMERIEVAVKAKLTNKYIISHGFFWYTNDALFANKEIFYNINAEIAETFAEPQEGFLKSFKFNYNSEPSPPSNMALETLTLGKLSRLYKGLSNNAEKVEIATEFNLVSSLLTSWLVYLTNVRNVCAHHSRLWNKKITADRPTIPSRDKFKFNGTMTDDFNTTIYGIISIMNKLLISFNPENHFIFKIEKLIEEYSIDAILMGFPADWKTEAHWYKENVDE
jgi:abortive infection bacteriophage resistance protein